MTTRAAFYLSALCLCLIFWAVVWFTLGPVPTAIIGVVCVLMVFGLAVTAP